MASLNPRPSIQSHTTTNIMISQKSKKTISLGSPSTLMNNCNIVKSFSIMIDWITQDILKKNIDFSLPLNTNTKVLDKCTHLLPLLTDLIINLNSANINSALIATFKNYNLSFLEFIYWSLLHCDSGLQNQVKIASFQIQLIKKFV